MNTSEKNSMNAANKTANAQNKNAQNKAAQNRAESMNTQDCYSSTKDSYSSTKEQDSYQNRSKNQSASNCR